MSVGVPQTTKESLVEEDLNHIFSSLSLTEKRRLQNASLLITGCAGFLGYYFMQFFCRFADDLKIRKIIGLENFITGNQDWLTKLQEDNPFLLNVYNFDVINGSYNDIVESSDVDYVIHLASIASPVFYRKHPLETVDANVTGLRRLLEFYKKTKVRGLLFMSSSEVYGDPHPDCIPTPESYRGNVSTTGPRACYDESKRMGETLCWLYNQQHSVPTRIVRPFNNYGPGMSVHDKRLPADFAQAVIKNEDIEILSDGSPRRTFCYISDALTGYLKALVHENFDIFNIGIDQPEISVKDLAAIYSEIGRKHFGYTGRVVFQKPTEIDYLVDNPQRRCPDIGKARRLLNYDPVITVEVGVKRYLDFLTSNSKE